MSAAKKMNKTSFGGKSLETVIGYLKLKHFRMTTHEEFTRKSRDLLSNGGDRWLVKNVPYTTLFRTPGRREYYVHSTEWCGEIECKFQNVGGSVDEKMVYVTETLKRTDLHNLFVVYGGEYWNSGCGAAIIEWLATEAELIGTEFEDKELLVGTLDQFIDWSNSTWE